MEHRHQLLYVREASCKEYRTEYYGCPCGQRVYQEYVSGEEHVYGPWTEVWVETCSVNVLKRECINCGAEHEEGWFTPSHSMDLWQIEIYPTCTDEGTFYRRCTECGEREEHSSEPYGHSFDSWQVVKEPTCQEEGERTRNCLYCQQTEREAIPGIDHQWSQGVVTLEPTWTKDGELTFTCLHCGEKKIETLAAIGKGPCDGGEDCWSRTFTDVPPVGDWAHEGIDFAVGMGLFNGMSEDTFAPNRTIPTAMLWGSVKTDF